MFLFMFLFISFCLYVSDYIEFLFSFPRLADRSPDSSLLQSCQHRTEFEMSSCVSNREVEKLDIVFEICGIISAM